MTPDTAPDNAVVIEAAYPGPPLMLIHPRRLSTSLHERIRVALDGVLRRRLPLFAIEEGMEVYQLIDGRWERLSP